MSKARLVITAVVVEGRSPTEVARTYGVARSWIYALVDRYRTDGDTAFEPRSKRPATRPRQTPTDTVELVVNLRRSLTRQGLDAGPATIAWHLEHHHHITLSRATIYRIVQRAELVVPEPRKKPRTSYVRFQAEQPNETWQADVTHWLLANTTDAEILTWLDDHARYALSVTAHHRVTGQTVVATFRAATDTHGIPFSTLTDNGLVFTTRFSQGRYDRVDNAGKVTLRHHGRLFHIGIGRPHARTPIILLVHDLDIRIIHAATGELLRQLTLDTTRTYQPTGAKRGGPNRPYGPRKHKRPKPQE